eukprot:7376989-Prymnesium_polylepis.1
MPPGADGGLGATSHGQPRVVGENRRIPEPIMTAVVVVRQCRAPRQPRLRGWSLRRAVEQLTLVDTAEQLANHQIANPLRDPAGPRPAHRHHQ